VEEKQKKKRPPERIELLEARKGLNFETLGGEGGREKDRLASQRAF